MLRIPFCFSCLSNNMVGEFLIGQTVVVIGGIVDVTGILSKSVTVCIIEQVGQKDLMVKTAASGARYVVPKEVCVLVDISKSALDSSRPLRPEIGDMVFYQGKLNWRDSSETSIAGTIYEIEYSYGKPIAAKVHHGSEMVKLPYEDLMVLQRSKPS